MPSMQPISKSGPEEEGLKDAHREDEDGSKLQSACPSAPEEPKAGSGPAFHPQASADVKASRSSPEDTGSGGTHNMGTRERASRAKTVPCGPGVSLARLTPATKMLG